MNTVLLKLTASYLKYILYVLAAWFFLKGHNNPGGGFIAGLLVSSAFMLNMLTYGGKEVRRSMKVSPINLAVSGVIVSTLVSLSPILFDLPFMTGMWLPDFNLPLLGAVHLGTPLLFDAGVLMTVIGFVVSVIFDLEKAE